MSGFQLGFGMEMPLETPLEFFYVTYKNGEKVKYRKQSHGEWKICDYGHFWACSECGYRVTDFSYGYCPNCATKMWKEGDEK